MALTTHMFWLRFRNFSTFLAFRSEVVIFGNSVFFRTLRLLLISAKPYYQNARIDRGIIFGFRKSFYLVFGG